LKIKIPETPLISFNLSRCGVWQKNCSGQHNPGNKHFRVTR
jgi:hypothetical protein